MRAKVLKGPRQGEIGEVVNYEETPHGRLNVVLFSGDDFALYADKEVEMIG